MTSTSEVPLLVGVVGSRTDTGTGVPAAAEAFAATLLDLRARYPNTPLLVLTASTSGAEAGAVRVAGEHDVPVVVCAESRNVDGDARELIAYVSDILVIVSDGTASSELEAFANRRRTGEPAPAGQRKILAPPDVGAYVLVEGASVRHFYPARFAGDVAAEAEFAAGLARRDRFNLDLRAVLDPPHGSRFERLRTRTASVTSQLQSKTRFGQHVLYTLGFLAASVQVFTFNPEGPYVKFAAVVLAFLVYFIIRRQDYQNRYQDYRAISEALRVQAVWSAIGISDSVEESYLPMQQTDLQWIRNVLRTVHFLDWPTEASPLGYDIALSWVSVEQQYYADHSRIEARSRRRFSVVATVLGTLSVLASIATLVAHLAHTSIPPAALAADIGIVAAFTALCVAIVRSYSRTRGHSENANRYQRMFFVFDKALDLLKRARGDDAQVRLIAQELGNEALAEHAEWLLLQRERPISIVHTDAP